MMVTGQPASGALAYTPREASLLVNGSLVFGWLLCGAIALSFLADPVVRALGSIELLLAASLIGCAATPVFVILRVGRVAALTLGDILVLAVIGSVLLSVLVGLGHEPPASVFRSSAPYLVLTLVTLARLARLTLDWRLILGTIFAIALGQSFYHIFLYFYLNTNFESNILILSNRITLRDPRTTIPFFLLLPSFAILIASKTRNGILLALISTILTLGIVSAFVTLTRTHLLVVCGSLIFLCVVALFRVFRRRHKPAAVNPVASLVAVGALIVSVVLLASVPQFKVLLNLVLLRTAIEEDITQSSEYLSILSDAASMIQGDTTVDALAAGYPALDELVDYFKRMPERVRQGRPAFDELANLIRNGIQQAGGDRTRMLLAALMRDNASIARPANRRIVDILIMKAVVEATSGPQMAGGGRLFDEWIPAFQHFKAAGTVSQMIGIGAGSPFTTASGEKRTYIHNYPLYVLLYQGIVGLALVAALLIWTFLRLLRGYLRSGDVVLLAAIAMLIVVEGSSLLFAVHKLISVNLMMAVILLIALNRPSEVVPSRGSA